MASLLKKVTKTVKTLTNPVTAVNPVATTRAALSVTPIDTTTATRAAAALTNPNPFSSDKMALTRAAMNPNPLETAKQTVSVISSTVSPTPTTKRVVPDRSGYAASEGAKANASEYYKAGNVAAAKAQGEAWNKAANAAAESAAVKNALDNDNPNTAAQVANELKYTAPEQVRIIYEGGNAARGMAAMEQQQTLPEVVVESDYKKYLIVGGSIILAVILWKKLK